MPVRGIEEIYEDEVTENSRGDGMVRERRVGKERKWPKQPVKIVWDRLTRRKKRMMARPWWREKKREESR
jgi:hypothetical protein